ncbi:overexpressed in colon carcinoma 1 protein isoform X2 [Lissotriton helveticus]
MGCGKSVATSQPGAGTTDAAKDITEESPTEDHQKRAGRRKVEVKSFAECPPNKHQLSSKTTISVRTKKWTTKVIRLTSCSSNRGTISYKRLFLQLPSMLCT